MNATPTASIPTVSATDSASIAPTASVTPAPGVPLDDIAAFSANLASFAPYTVARNAATSAGVRAAARNPLPYRVYHDTYSVSLSPTGDVTNQRQSGRCWLFAACNVLRERMMASLGTSQFELSQAYLQFWDKLEKCNLFLDEMVRLADRPIDDREILERLQKPAGDGGWWDMAVALVEKYGVVPKQCMPDTANSCNTADLNDLLYRKLRADVMPLREAVARGASDAELADLKRSMLSDLYRMLAIALGEPPATFDFAYVADARPAADQPASAAAQPAGPSEQPGATRPASAAAQPGAFVRLENLTPRAFFSTYANVNLHDYVSLVDIPGPTRPYGAILEMRHIASSTVSGVPIRALNMPIDVLKRGVIEQLKAGHPAWFACDVEKNMERTDATGLLDTQTIDAPALFGLDFSIEKGAAYDLREITLNHAMTFQGVDLRADGTPSAWRVENSWGKEKCRDGYFIITDRWFDAYVGQVIVHRDYLPADVVRAWDDPATPVVQMNPWDPMFGCSD